MSTLHMGKALLRTSAFAAALAAASLLSAAPSQATPLAPGTSIPSPFTDFDGTTYGAPLATATTAFSTPGDIDGTARAAVFLNAGGTLDFVYQVSVTTTDGSGVQRFTVSDFGFPPEWTTDILQSDDAFSIFLAGTEAADSADRSLGGSTVGFQYGIATPLSAGETSLTYIVRTNATEFVPGLFTVQNGGSQNVPGFQPAAAAVPEPVSMALLLPGLVPLALTKLRRRNKPGKEG